MVKIKNLENCVLNRLLAINANIRLSRTDPNSLPVTLDTLKEQRTATDKLLSRVKKLLQSNLSVDESEKEYKLLIDLYINAKIF